VILIMTDWEFSNGADGTCQECGADTDEEWHVLCCDCYGKQQGWRRPDPPGADALRWQHEDRQRLVTAALLARIDQLDRLVVTLDRRLAVIEGTSGRRTA
jgi:hypothetical protein